MKITQITVHCNFSSWSGTGQLFHHVNDLLTSARKHEHNSVHSLYKPHLLSIPRPIICENILNYGNNYKIHCLQYG